MTLIQSVDRRGMVHFFSCTIDRWSALSSSSTAAFLPSFSRCSCANDAIPPSLTPAATTASSSSICRSFFCSPLTRRASTSLSSGAGADSATRSPPTAAVTPSTEVDASGAVASSDWWFGSSATPPLAPFPEGRGLARREAGVPPHGVPLLQLRRLLRIYIRQGRESNIEESNHNTNTTGPRHTHPLRGWPVGRHLVAGHETIPHADLPPPAPVGPLRGCFFFWLEQSGAFRVGPLKYISLHAERVRTGNHSAPVGIDRRP